MGNSVRDNKLWLEMQVRLLESDRDNPDTDYKSKWYTAVNEKLSRARRVLDREQTERKRSLFRKYGPDVLKQMQDKCSEELRNERITEQLVIAQEAALLKKLDVAHSELVKAEDSANSEFEEFKRQQMEKRVVQKNKLVQELESAIAKMAAVIGNLDEENFSSKSFDKKNDRCGRYLGLLKECPASVEEHIPELKRPEALEKIANLTKAEGEELMLSVEQGKYVTITSTRTKDLSSPFSLGHGTSYPEETVGIGFGNSPLKSWKKSTRCAHEHYFN